MADNRTYRDGLLAGMALAVDLLRAQQDAPTFNDAGEEFWPSPGESADEIEEAAKAIEVATVHP